MTITQISFTVQIDTDAVQNYLSLLGWVKFLNIDTVTPTWDDVYRELGAILVGAPHYQRFCRTAQRDIETLTPFKLYERVETKTPATPGFEQADEPKPAKVVTPPPTPAPRRSGAKA